MFLPLMPSAIERFDLCRYDVVVSFSYAIAHGVHVKDGTRHVSYTYTPMRYAWSDLNLDGTHSHKNPLLDLLMGKFRTGIKQLPRVSMSLLPSRMELQSGSNPHISGKRA
jgi:hypothetical protein